MVTIKGWVTVARTVDSVEVMFGEPSADSLAAGLDEEDIETNGMRPFTSLPESENCTSRLFSRKDHGHRLCLTETKSIHMLIANNHDDLGDIEGSRRFVVIQLDRQPGQSWLKDCVLHGQPLEGAVGPVPEMSRLMANGIQPFKTLTDALRARSAYIRACRAEAAVASFNMAGLRGKKPPALAKEVA